MDFLCPSAALPEAQGRGFQVNGMKVLAVRRQGRVYVYHNHCPHRGLSLQWQPDQFLDDSASLIQCAHHGALFLIESGECIAGPCAGDGLTALESCEDPRGVWLVSR